MYLTLKCHSSYCKGEKKNVYCQLEIGDFGTVLKCNRCNVPYFVEGIIDNFIAKVNKLIKHKLKTKQFTYYPPSAPTKNAILNKTIRNHWLKTNKQQATTKQTNSR